MKEREWTFEQRAAIDHPPFPDKSAIVSAAAGSGKTSVLVERVRRLITGEGRENGEPVPADKIVLVTFTRKAAAEMKGRLEAALLSRLESSGYSWAEEQLARLDDAQITTINAFCLNILRENAGPAGLEPGFSVAEDEETELLAKKAMDDALEKFYGGDGGEITAALAFFGGNGDAALRRAVRELYAFTRNLPNPDDWVDEQLRLYKNPDAYYRKLVPPFSAIMEAKRNEAAALTEESLNAAEYGKTRAFLQKALDFFDGSSDDYPRMYIDKNEDAAVKELIKENNGKAKAVRDELYSARGLILSFKEAVGRLEPVIGVLARLYRLYSECFAARKKAARVIDFADSEHLCLKLLRDNRAASERVRRNCEFIIVDEFQDSNFLQYEIFRLLDGGRNRLFFVGDIKQSVYRFRGADPEAFALAAGSGDYKTLYLSDNFRSSKEVIQSVNDIFESAMPGYDENAKLRAGKGFSDGAFKTEFALLGENDFPDIGDGAEKEARYTALRVKEMTRNGFSVFDKDGGFRPCRWGDFAVLTSAGEKNFRVYKKAFEEAGVPCAGEGGNDYLKTEETGLALDLLAVIDNPYDDLSLLNVLMSPLYGFSAEELAKMRAGRKDVPLYSAVVAANKESPSERTAAFLGSLSRFRRIADSRGVTELISAVNDEGGFLPLIVKGNTQKRANLRLLSYYAERFSEKKADGSLPAFLAYIKDIRDGGGDVRQAAVNAETGRVRLLTIHKAKGLEFPVCFVGRTNQKFNFRGVKVPPLIKLDKEAGICARVFDGENLCRFKTLHMEYAERLNRDYTRAEETRKLYVAATRAESKLIFTGFAKDGKINADSYAERLAGIERLTVDGARFGDNAQPEAGDSRRADISGEVGQIVKNITAVYPREILAAVPRKMTATQVGVIRETTADEADEPAVFPRNPSFYGEKRLTGKKRGDAYHKAMELIDFTRGDYAGQLRELEPRFTPIEHKAVNPADIEGFFKSELGRRAVKSGKVVKEYKLYTEIEPPVPGFDDRPFVQGMADMFFYEDGEIVLTDYKTNRNTSPEKLIREYGGQLRVYKKAIEEMTGDRVKECWLYSFERGAIKLF
ncbi:MAG: UvrD-helicase domain-containing protein [Oscillospiraceae bacterium]|nr:UvrD-helicase domain-containing protein [Oscillospiraceae bacterium]